MSLIRWLQGRVAYRIFFPFFFIIILGVSIALPYGVRTTTRIMEDRANAQVMSAANAVASLIRKDMDKLLTFAELKMYSAPIQDAINRRDINLIRQLVIPIKVRSRMDVVIIFDRNGQEMIRFDEQHIMGEQVGDLKIVHNGIRGMKYQDMVAMPSRLILCAVAPNETALVPGGMNGALLVGQVMDDRFVAEMKETTGTDLVISNTEGNIMASTLRDRGGFSDFLSLKRVASSLQAEQQTALDTFTVEKVPYRTVHQVFGIHHEPRAIISVIMDVSQSYRNTRNVITVMIFLMVSGVAAAVLFSLWIAQSISRPIERLARATEHVAAGDLSQKISDVSSDEIGRLSQSFNGMIERMRRYIEEIRDARNKAQNYSAELEVINRELKQTRSELIQASKMVAMGQLGAGIAHELNQPLLAIGLFAEQTLLKLKEGTPEYRTLERIIGQVTRMSTIVNEIRLFSRQSLLEPKEIDINQPIQKALALVEKQLSDANIAVEWKPVQDLPPVMADDNQLQQVFLNIITNARDAIAPHGKGRIAISIAEAHQGEFLVIEFTDDGVGIHQEIINEIFMPFFTTKKATKGIGLGLSISYGIIERHSGSISVTSVPGQRTTFRILLPTARARHCWEVITCSECRPGGSRDACPVYTKDRDYYCWTHFQRAGEEEQITVRCQKCSYYQSLHALVSSGVEARI